MAQLEAKNSQNEIARVMLIVSLFLSALARLEKAEDEPLQRSGNG